MVPFRGHVSRLCTRARKTGWALRGNVIRNTFPEWLRKKVNVTKTEDAFWSSVEESVTTELMDRHRAEDRHRNDNQPTKLDADKAECRPRNRKKCIFCSLEDHDITECQKMKAARATLQSNCQTGQSRPDPSRSDQPATFPTTAPRSGPPEHRNLTCYNCQRVVHISTFCP